MESNNDHEDFQRRISAKERRKLRAKRRGNDSVWEGFSVFGLIGWSVAIPTVVFVLLGIWLDERYGSSRQSYTLALLTAGLFLGCFNAWYWVSRKMKELEEKPTDDEDPT
jgi:ATP synthase protein I